MDKIYTAYKCKNSQCGKENILITEQVGNTLKQGKYISCSHCGCKSLKKENITDDLRKCMDHSTWKKVNGKTRQVHSE